jgi:outer membrane protein TolC
LNAGAILGSLTQVDFQSRPDLKAKELQTKAAEDQSAASQTYWFPKIKLIGEYQWYNSQSYNVGSNVLTDTGIYQNSYFIGASASWDFLDGGMSVAKANEAGERARQARDDFEASKLRAPYDFDLWKRRLASSVSLYQAKLTDVDKAMESVRLATLGFKAGTRTTTDVLDAELDQFRASSGVVQAQVSAMEALINLEMAVGKKIGHE